MSTSKPTQRRTFWAWTAATFFGVGFGKPGPGTYGSIAAVLLWCAVAFPLHPGPIALQLILATGIALSIALGVPASTLVERESGREDPGFVVIDEVAGQWVALLGCRADWREAAAALILFRIFDILKPWPARQLESLPRGWGIVFDDVAAGLYAWGIGAILRIWI